MRKLAFFNACRILLNVDRHDLVENGIIEAGRSGDMSWKRFNSDPLVFIAKLSDEGADALWALIQRRQPAKYREAGAEQARAA